MRLGQSNPDLSLNLTESGHRVINVEESVSSQLVINYKTFFKRELKSDIEIPQEYSFPLVVRLEENQIMMLWISTEFERSVWAKTFRDMILPNSPYIQNPAELPKLVTTDSNEFIATLYRCLVPIERTKTGMIKQ